MLEVKCNICKKVFYVKPSHQKLGYGKYCSIACRGAAQKRGKTVECNICQKEIWKMPRDIKRSKSKLYFCGKSCQTKWRNKYFSGERHANWKNGEAAYREILKRSDKPLRCEDCGLEDERVLVVHHIDSDRRNNDLENLIWVCCNCHFLVHQCKTKIKK